jgi:hypothetical protein
VNDEFDIEAKRRKQEEYLSNLEAAKTDDRELAEVLEEYDLDEAILNEYNTVCKRFQHLKQEFLSLKRVTALRFEKNG